MLFFITGLVISGVTAFPLLMELRFLSDLLGVGSATSSDGHTGLAFWILTVRLGLEATYSDYPWIGYGTDWLAFGHLVIAGFFIGPMIDPRTSRSAILTGITACVAVIPLAMICGPHPRDPVLLAAHRLFVRHHRNHPAALLSQTAQVDGSREMKGPRQEYPAAAC
ncbi:hypothetical protein JIN84_14360 [Luteolibacter yonseiensis]|uniref:Uncharacterized protein n=1 Tax=Luteolibacter yonseiensis TaxID=1144680 RepID=A0A934R7T2_9BACT|nr:hypothetical protein [Luteolibacter yonseiensis]MBK1816805.1 hypothetical protein [Luteolibacter yonseiensis]